MNKFNYTYLVYLNEPKSSLYGCLYYGRHTTNKLNDGYIGSGKILCNYLKKYPNGYYRKILNFYNTQEELNKAEYDLIHPHLGKEYCLNLTDGGLGTHLYGKDHPMYGKHLSEETKRKISESKKGKPSCNKGKHLSDETKLKLSLSHKGKISPMKGKQRTEEFKNKQRLSHIGKPAEFNRHPRSNDEKKLISIRTKEAMNNLDVKCKLGSGVRGKHKVWDNKELKIYHFE